MALSQKDIISKITDFRQESATNISKQKLTVPRRIMEEEVWLSGSELKTDNSSSDEERHAINPADRVKKGAKKKTKMTSQNARTRTKIVREQRQQESSSSVIETTFQTEVKESSSTTTTSAGDFDVIVVDTNEVQWRPKRGSISLPGLANELERVQI